MSVTLKNSPVYADTGSPGSLTVSLNGYSTVSGDVEIVVAGYDTNGTTGSVTMVGGYTSATGAGASLYWTGQFYHAAGAGDANPVITASSGSAGVPFYGIAPVFGGLVTGPVVANSVFVNNQGLSSVNVAYGGLNFAANGSQQVLVVLTVAVSTTSTNLTDAYSQGWTSLGYLETTLAGVPISTAAFYQVLSAGQNLPNGNIAITSAGGSQHTSYTVVGYLASASTNVPVKLYANGAFQANNFVQGGLPAGTALRIYANGTIQSAVLTINGGGKIKLYANGNLVVNSIIT